MVRRFGLVLALAFVLAGCGGPPDMGAKSVTLQADYPAYENLAALYAKADLVAAVVLAGSTELLPPSDDLPVVYTVFTGKVERIFKGQAGGEIKVKQVGGAYRGTTFHEAGTVGLEPGARYLVFVEVYPDSPASLLNPGQGQYRLGPTGSVMPVGDQGLEFSLAELEQLAG